MFTNLCRKMWITLDSLKRDERGVTAIEYALMAAGVAMLLALVVFNVAEDDNWFKQIFKTMQDTVEGEMTGGTGGGGEGSGEPG